MPRDMSGIHVRFSLRYLLPSLLLVCVFVMYLNTMRHSGGRATPSVDTATTITTIIDPIIKDSNPSPASQYIRKPPVTTPTQKRIAYAITITKDGSFLDGGLVLGYSIKKAHRNSPYAADLVAFVTSKVQAARPVLQKYGWTILEKDLPVPLDDIENEKYVNKMKDSGCCGADEFLKLWSYTLIDYHRVVHLDMDTIIYRNMVLRLLSTTWSNRRT